MYEIFEKLLKDSGITAYKVSKETGISTATLTSWKKGNYTPKADKLQKIADYFGVSMEYLLTGQDPDPGDDVLMDIPRFTDGEMKLLEVFKKLSAEKQDEVINYGLFLLSKQNDELKKSSPSSKEA